MRRHIFLGGITLLLSSCVGGAVRSTGRPFDGGGFGAFRCRVPPELVSSPWHWMNASDVVTLEKLQGQVIWLQFNF